ncbi:hypothetical protein BV87_05925 [Sphingobium yanoikuyae]|uniref:Uncharacterized protein n=1 Tax=Sphingobium yanoikuyae TaxID=13690 RepID=A0A2D1QZD7_SPHYA|nr:hypothetical protein BV87_05925 [Sphingobium yanoikuyae]
MHAERFVDLRQRRAVIGYLLSRGGEAFKCVTEQAQFPAHSVKSYRGIIFEGAVWVMIGA